MDTTDFSGFHSKITIDVAWGEMDAFEHVNNAVYFRYIESARIKYLSDVGWDDGDPDLLPILSSVKARFYSAVTFPDRLEVGTRPVEMRSHLLVLEHMIVSQKSGGMTTLGNSFIVPFNRMTKKTEPIPASVAARIKIQLCPSSPSEDPTATDKTD